MIKVEDRRSYRCGGVPASKADHGAAPTRGASISLTKWDGWTDSHIDGMEISMATQQACHLKPSRVEG